MSTIIKTYFYLKIFGSLVDQPIHIFGAQDYAIHEYYGYLVHFSETLLFEVFQLY